MATWNLGSIAATVQSIVPDIPTAISGAELIAISDRQRLFAESFTGQSIGSVSIAEKYQPALVSLTIAATAQLMMFQGADVSNIRLGEFSVSQGAGGNLATTSEYFQKDGMQKLQELGRGLSFYKALG